MWMPESDEERLKIVPLHYESKHFFIPMQEMPPAWGGLNPYEMAQKKKTVPPRDERLEKMGDPKPPKMGKVAPTKIDVPPVDDLLEQLKKVTAPLERCTVDCQCLPCQQGRCDGCHVERVRDNPDRDVVRAAVTQYRGVLYGR